MGNAIYLRRGESMTKPEPGVLASSLEVGTSVYLIVNGQPTEFIVVHQGLPSRLYDESCDGTWLLMKDCYEKRTLGGDVVQLSYEGSDLHQYLNCEFLNLLDHRVQAYIKQVKIPYGIRTYQWDRTNSNGMLAKVFLLDATEVSCDFDRSILTDDRCALSYFEGCPSKDGVACDKRRAYLNESGCWWTLRICGTDGVGFWPCIRSDGSCDCDVEYNKEFGIRPALILPNRAVFTVDTLEFTGVR